MRENILHNISVCIQNVCIGHTFGDLEDILGSKCIRHLDDILGPNPKPEKQIEIGGLILAMMVPDYMIK